MDSGDEKKESHNKGRELGDRHYIERPRIRREVISSRGI
jgi:hypothetical protein